MAYDRWGVLKVRGIDPEVFWIVSFNSAMTNPFMGISDDLSETELRAELKTRGVAETEIESLIAGARANPK